MINTDLRKQRITDVPEIPWLAQNLAETMEAKGLTAVDLFERSRVAESTISNVLNQKYNPTLRTLSRLAAALNCTVARLTRPPRGP